MTKLSAQELIEILEEGAYISPEIQRQAADMLRETLAIPQLYCGECDRYERDPIFLDVERCSKCGELIEGSDDA